MKFKEIKSLSIKELEKKIKEQNKDVFEMKMKNSLGQLNNPLQIRYARKDVARLLTALNSKSE